MTCDLCAKNEATVHLTEIVNNQTRELHLCEICAHEKGTQAAEQFGLGELLAGLADFSMRPGGKTAEKMVCDRCQLTYEDFRKTGRLGCDHCYETFHKFLAPLLKRIHGSTQHVGLTPPPAAAKGKGEAAPEQALEKLKEKLKTAIASESFEEAARLRDRIRTLQRRSRP